MNIIHNELRVRRQFIMVDRLAGGRVFLGEGRRLCVLYVYRAYIRRCRKEKMQQVSIALLRFLLGLCLHSLQTITKRSETDV